MKKAVICFIIFTASIISAQQTSLRDTLNQYDYVIITIPELEETCNDFRQHKENYNDFSVLITTKDEILSEFTDSVKVEENIRDFISYAATYWSNPTPKYFLFAGDVDRLPNFKIRALPNPAYPKNINTDYFYGVNKFNSNEDISIFIGRISAQNTIQLQNYFDKIIDYDNSPNLPWRNRSLIVADDMDNTPFGDAFETYSLEMKSVLPTEIHCKTVFESDTSNYFGTTDTLLNYMNNGTSSVLFCGHGGYNYFTHDSLFHFNDIANLQNEDKPFFFCGIFGQIFSDSSYTSMIDQMILSENGAIGGIVPVSVVFFNSTLAIYSDIWMNLYSGQSIGQINAIALNESTFANEYRKYNIFGDPSLILKYSQPVVNVNDDVSIPNNFELSQNYPNPFNPSTTINFYLPESGRVQVEVYNILGTRVAQLVNSNLQQGEHSISFNGSNLSSGIYFYRLSVGENIITKKMTLLK